MSITSIRDGLIETIASYGKWTKDEISACDFGIANFSGSCVILQPGPGNVIEPRSYGGGSTCGAAREKNRVWDIAGVVMVKDPGDPTAFLGAMWTAVDDIFNSINHDDTLNGTAEVATLRTISRPSIDAFFTDGNVDWGYITFSVEALEL